MGEGVRRKAGVRFTAARRARYLEVLEQTGNGTAAAEAAGIHYTTARAWREKDAAFAAGCAAAVAAAERRLARARDPFDGVEDGRFEVIQRARTGRLQIMAVRPGRWTKKVENRFFDALRACGNVAASARLAGFSESAVWLRNRRWPAFSRRMQETLEDADLGLEFRLACMGNNVGARFDPDGEEVAQGAGPADGEPAELPPGNGVFDPSLALKYLRWRDEKKRGGGRRGRISAPPSIEEVTMKIVRKVEAIKRAREKRGSGGS